MTVRMPWSHIKTTALLLLLIMLAHDTVMAGDPHAGSHHAAHVYHHGDTAPVAGAAHHAAVPVTVPAGDGLVLVADGEPPCGPVVALRPPSPPDALPGRGATGITRALPADERPVVALVRRDDPDHPPDVRRALLQVFLN